MDRFQQQRRFTSHVCVFRWQRELQSLVQHCVTQGGEGGSLTSLGDVESRGGGPQRGSLLEPTPPAQEEIRPSPSIVGLLYGQLFGQGGSMAAQHKTAVSPRDCQMGRCSPRRGMAAPKPNPAAVPRNAKSADASLPPNTAWALTEPVDNSAAPSWQISRRRLARQIFVQLGKASKDIPKKLNSGPMTAMRTSMWTTRRWRNSCRVRSFVVAPFGS